MRDVIREGDIPVHRPPRAIEADDMQVGQSEWFEVMRMRDGRLFVPRVWPVENNPIGMALAYRLRRDPDGFVIVGAGDIAFPVASRSFAIPGRISRWYRRKTGRYEYGDVIPVVGIEQGAWNAQGRD